jgi:predicted nucleotidyltransferase
VSFADDKDLNRVLKLLPEADPHRTVAEVYARDLSGHDWLVECKLFGTVGRGEHGPGEDVDVAVVFDQSMISEDEVRTLTAAAAEQTKARTGIAVVPLCVSAEHMARRGGLASELRDKETIWPKGGTRSPR